MNATAAIAIGAFMALLLAIAVRRRALPRGPSPGEDSLARELAGLREQLDSGELDRADYELLRERLAARLAAGPSDELAGSIAEPRSWRRRSWRWPLAGALAAAIVVATLIPAVRQRGMNDFPTGNDFAASASGADSAIMDWQMAEQAFAKRDYEQAVERFRAAVAFRPDLADLRARFGFALANAGRTQEALAQLRLAVRKAPELPSGRLYLGAVLLRTGDRSAAFEQWRRFLELQPAGNAADFVRSQLSSTPPAPGASTSEP